MRDGGLPWAIGSLTYASYVESLAAARRRRQSPASLHRENYPAIA